MKMLTITTVSLPPGIPTSTHVNTATAQVTDTNNFGTITPRASAIVTYLDVPPVIRSK